VQVTLIYMTEGVDMLAAFALGMPTVLPNLRF
jgi:hypothetical protein